MSTPLQLAAIAAALDSAANRIDGDAGAMASASTAAVTTTNDLGTNWGGPFPDQFLSVAGGYLDQAVSAAGSMATVAAATRTLARDATRIAGELQVLMVNRNDPPPFGGTDLAQYLSHLEGQIADKQHEWDVACRAFDANVSDAVGALVQISAHDLVLADPTSSSDAGGLFVAGFGGVVGEPPSFTDPEAVTRWWYGLSEGEQLAYVLYHPAAIGAMDGIPTVARHASNIERLRVDAARGHDRANAQKLLDRIERSWNRLDEMEIYLMGYEPPGPGSEPDARVIASVGNPDLVNNVATYVPGTGTDLSNIGGSIDRMADLREASTMIPNSGTTATIVWLGYDAPDGLHNAASGGYARDAAHDLRAFTEGLAATSQNPASRATVIGHSYGSTVVGTADALADRGLATDDIIVMGSPGMGYRDPASLGFFDTNPMINKVDHMHIGKENFWAGAAGNDPVTYLEVHGNSPVDWSFGGQRVDTAGASGHSEYWDPGTEALRNQALIVTGNHDLVGTTRRRFG